MQEAKHTDTSETVTKESESQEAEAVSEQVEIAVEKTQEAKDTDSSNMVPKDRETQEAEAVSEIAILKKVSAIVDIENEIVLEIELGTSELLTEPDSNVVSIVPESNIVSNVNRVESISCDANIRKEDLTDSENECTPPEVIFPKPVIPTKLMEGDTLDDSSMGESLQQSLQCGEKNIPQTTDSDSVDAEYPEQLKGRKRKLAEEEDTPEEPNMKHSAGSQRLEGPASVISRSPGYRKLFA